MAVHTPTAHPIAGDAQLMLAAMRRARAQTLALVGGCSEEQLERVHSPIMSPLVWDLAHIAAYEDLWIAHRHGGGELLRPELAGTYDAFETPRAARAEAELLDPAGARDYMQDVRERTVEVLERVGTGDGVICEMVLRHELQHCETMRQTMAIAGLLPDGEPPAGVPAEAPGWTAVPAGSFMMGAAEEGFSYDNERPRHEVFVGAFTVARVPVSNASWMHFSEGGGYVRREWWSDEGWAWKEEFDITHHPSVADGAPQAPVCHVSWFEAEAFARAHEARLPTEAEWERAATSTQGTEQLLGGRGQVWEWTASTFGPYPGFRAHPYREYSEVFFGRDYRVLRGGSWATHPRVASTTFRNWDLPLRRQIFSGVRLAREG
ncbi:MAG TPA: SUMF1/EgtB/PvdO family nonheme iron enzyme [Solirubrobacteraceae bacterium]|nr:SUMF1/EgtB/PvdO family nonheme iron enzyme [Solirubrobacteraceae bacterium]